MALTKTKTTGQVWDVVVIGGGPAGMMAAATAASRGKLVLLLEKNPSLGKKLLISGGGRCNVTNNKPDIREMLSRYGTAGKFLFSAFVQHSVTDSIRWFDERGVPFIEENEGRLFPATESAQTIFATLVSAMKKAEVIVRTRAGVAAIMRQTYAGGFMITLASKEVVLAKTCIVATGGVSRPETGSTGEGFLWLKNLGHNIVPNNYALVPLLASDTWVSALAGVTLKNIKMTLYADGKKQSVHAGKLLFTHVGLSGPTVLNLSKTVGELLSHSHVTLKINLAPDLDAGELKARLQALFSDESNKKLKNVLSAIVPAAVVVPLLTLANVSGETPCHSVKSGERSRIATMISALPINIKGLQGAEKAVVSGGGVAPTEINFKTMESRVVPDLYIVGDVLDINRPSGGYGLQLCWTTGFVAGESA